MFEDRGWNHLDVQVDAGPPRRLGLASGRRFYAVAAALEDGEHVARVARRNEGHGGVTTFIEARVDEGELLAPPVAPPLRLEFIGDSITAGFGVDGQDPCRFEYRTENHEAAYPARVGRAMNAEVRTLAWSGWGMLRGADGTRGAALPLIYLRTLPTLPAKAEYVWDTQKWRPDAVVIALGTNDYAKGDPGPAFEAAYVAFLSRLRGAFPAAWLLGTTSPMLNGAPFESQAKRVQAAVEKRGAMGDERVTFVRVAPQTPSEGYGCGHHPGPRVHQRVAEELERVLREKLVVSPKLD
jgi:lysophospholipase L1-like esterase